MHHGVQLTTDRHDAPASAQLCNVGHSLATGTAFATDKQRGGSSSGDCAPCRDVSDVPPSQCSGMDDILSLDNESLLASVNSGGGPFISDGHQSINSSSDASVCCSSAGHGGVQLSTPPDVKLNGTASLCPDPRRLLVGNLPHHVTASDLLQAFSIYGDVESVKIVHNDRTGRCRGFAFLKYTTLADAQRATEKMDGKFYGDRVVTVRPATVNRNAPHYGSRGASNHHDSSPPAYHRPLVQADGCEALAPPPPPPAPPHYHSLCPPRVGVGAASVLPAPTAAPPPPPPQCLTSASSTAPPPTAAQYSNTATVPTLMASSNIYFTPPQPQTYSAYQQHYPTASSMVMFHPLPFPLTPPQQGTPLQKQQLFYVPPSAPPPPAFNGMYYQSVQPAGVMFYAQ